MKKIIAITFFIFSSILLVQSSHAQSFDLQKALSETREGLDSLITTKDAAKEDDLTLRISTYNNVLTLLSAEGKELKVRLLALDDLDKDEDRWRDEKVKRFTDIALYLATDMKQIEKDEEKITRDDIKTRAESLKNWRETAYLPLVEEVRDYFLLQQLRSAVETTSKRWQKVQLDVMKIQKSASNSKSKLAIQKLLKSLESAKTALHEAEEKAALAGKEFSAKFILPLIPQEVSTSTPTSSISFAPLYEITTLVTSTLPIPTSSIALEEKENPPPPSQPSPLSIKDLARDILTKVRETYQIFIEMSASVRDALK